MLKKQVSDRRVLFAGKNSVTDTLTIPKEMIFASASGLDPHITPKAALLQLERVVKTRHFDESQKQRLLNSITELSEPPQFSLLGEHRINVLLLNLKLDEIK